MQLPNAVLGLGGKNVLVMVLKDRVCDVRCGQLSEEDLVRGRGLVRLSAYYSDLLDIGCGSPPYLWYFLSEVG